MKNSSTKAETTTSSLLIGNTDVSCRTFLSTDNVVIVIDNSNYKASYAEKVPFKAKVENKYDNEIIVKSLKTGKEYELYYTQILEALDIEEIIKILDLSKYGD